MGLLDSGLFSGGISGLGLVISVFGEMALLIRLFNLQTYYGTL
jgi:hypothetical protein